MKILDAYKRQDVSLGIHEIKDIVVVTFDRFPVFPDTVTLRKLKVVGNKPLQALYDRSDGFYRRQLVLTTKEKPVDRADDPDLAEKMKAEAEGIFLWAFEGLQRLVANNFKFTESERIRENREAVKRDNNNIFDFMDSEGYIQRKEMCIRDRCGCRIHGPAKSRK